MVARPTRWGNPFQVGVHGDRGECVRLYRHCVSVWPCTPETLELWRSAKGYTALLVALAGDVRPVLDVLKGKDLCCWCALDQPCHADVLLELANR